jgi:hypothetical protein
VGAGGKKRKKAGTGGYFPENKAARLVAKTLAIEYRDKQKPETIDKPEVPEIRAQLRNQSKETCKCSRQEGEESEEDTCATNDQAQKIVEYNEALFNQCHKLRRHENFANQAHLCLCCMQDKETTIQMITRKSKTRFRTQ